MFLAMVPTVRLALTILAAVASKATVYSFHHAGINVKEAHLFLSGVDPYRPTGGYVFVPYFKSTHGLGCLSGTDPDLPPSQGGVLPLHHKHHCWSE